MIEVFCKNTGTKKAFKEGTTLLKMVREFEFEKPYDILAAKVNHVTEGLKYAVYNNKEVEFLDYRSYGGRNVYCRSLCFLVCKAAKDIFPDCKVVLRRPISKGYYCLVDKGDGTELTAADVKRVSSRMKKLVARNIAFYRHEVRASEAIEMFRRLGYDDKVKLLETSGDIYIGYYTLDGTADYFYEALVPSTGYLKKWELSFYQNGMLLRVPDRHHPESLAPFYPQPKTFEVFSEMQKWNRIMKLANVGDVNKACLGGKVSDLVQIAEALQEKKIVQIAEEIERRYYSKDPIRVVLITGPTGSGKSTFCKRLSVQLMACGLRPVSFSTDDYFVNRVETPKLPDGSYDFDNFDTVDHDYLQSDLMKLIAGEEVEVPQFNFVTGLREYNGKRLKMEEGTVVLIEGIHALNPRLTDQVPASSKYKIFINTITSISLDDHNCIPTSDNRLLRRIVRDFNSGAFSARETISNWPMVRRNEVKWIYPFQEEADVLFNSAYLVEFAVFRVHAERILATVPHNSPEYGEAHRLLNFLHYFVPVSDKEIPPTSFMRGFLGR